MARAWGKIARMRSGRWQASYLGPDGRRHNGPATYRTKREAGAWLDAEHAAIGAGTWKPPERRTAGQEALTVAEAAELWLADLERAGRKPKTLANHRSRLRVAVLDRLGGRPIAEVTRVDVEDWWSSYAEATAEHPSAKRAAYLTLSALMGWAVRQGIRTETPCRIEGATRHEPVKPAPHGHVLTPGQVAQVHEAMTPENRVAVSLAAWCQLRQGEILGLHRGDLDLDDGLLHVRRQVQHLPGQGMVELDPKSDAGKRTIAIPGQVVAELRAHLADYAGPAIVMPRTGAPGEYLHPNSFRNRWASACRRVGLEGFVFHDLRHTGLTIYAQQGATAAELLHRGGHSSLEVALRYQHATIERDRLLVQALEAVI